MLIADPEPRIRAVEVDVSERVKYLPNEVMSKSRFRGRGFQGGTRDRPFVTQVIQK